ncbi:MAG: PAS domain S-box protein, partial [Chloroflexi bacterium]|nr:PAS domain S-box protein [Chloroflexota bacterium]
MDEKVLPFKNFGIGVDVQGNSWSGDLDYRALFEQTGDCVFIISLDFKILAVNPQANRMLGYSDDELPGSSAEVFLNLDHSSRRETIFGKRLKIFEYNLRRKDG